MLGHVWCKEDETNMLHEKKRRFLMKVALAGTVREGASGQFKGGGY